MSDAIEFRLNGKNVRVEGVSPNLTLLDWLRSTGLTGSKEGCAEGDCGACSVAMIDRDSKGKPTYRAINSCLVPLPLMSGRDVVTVEGVAGERLHPVQQAMVENHGSQCGYCTPGFIMSLFEGFHRRDLKTCGQLDEQLCGNLCRCTGYRAIRDAAADAFAQRDGDDLYANRLKEAPGKVGSARYSNESERFFRPTSLKQLFVIMAKHPDARIIAGATEMGLAITKRYQKFPALIAVDGVTELAKIRKTDSEWIVGGAATLTNIDDTAGRI